MSIARHEKHELFPSEYPYSVDLDVCELTPDIWYYISDDARFFPIPSSPKEFEILRSEIISKDNMYLSEGYNLRITIHYFPWSKQGRERISNWFKNNISKKD